MRYLLGLLLATGLVAQSSAHELKTALSSVLFNPRSGNIEVMHRFYVHDAEHAVKQLFDKSADLINSELTQQTFSQYVSQRFALQQLSGEAISLTLLGGELDGRFFWVYQEAVAPIDLPGVSVAHSSLQDVWPAQLNIVNIDRNGETKSLSFDRNSGWQQVQF
jgi:hypothetical protein